MEFAPAAASQQRGPPLTRLNLAHPPRLCDRGRGTSSPRGSPPWAAGGVGQEGPREMGGRASGGLQRPQHQALRDSAQEAPSSALPGAAAVGEPRPRFRPALFQRGLEVCGKSRSPAPRTCGGAVSGGSWSPRRGGFWTGHRPAGEAVEEFPWPSSGLDQAGQPRPNAPWR